MLTDRCMDANDSTHTPPLDPVHCYPKNSAEMASNGRNEYKYMVPSCIGGSYPLSDGNTYWARDSTLVKD